MRIAVVYVFAAALDSTYAPMARRFAKAYLTHPPGETDHDLYVVVNGGGQITPRQERLFSPLAPVFIYHDNSGKDIGAYRMAARNIPCDLLICLGGPTRPRLAGWLDRMVRAVEENGPGLYGCWGFHQPAVHLRTTVFWVSPELLNAYPHEITNEKRYFFEHGADSITAWCFKRGFPVYQTTARGTFSVEAWHHVEQKDSLFSDQHGDRAGWRDE